MKSLFAYLIGNKSPTDQDDPEKNCVFCQIAQHKHQDSRTIVYEDETLVVFPDIQSAGVLHLQVVSKKHIVNVNALQKSQADYDLVLSMLNVGKAVTEKMHPGAKTKFGFHVEPFHSVLHLHMHAFVLPHKLRQSWLTLKYSSLTPWWLPAEKLLEKLKP